MGVKEKRRREELVGGVEEGGVEMGREGEVVKGRVKKRVRWAKEEELEEVHIIGIGGEEKGWGRERDSLEGLVNHGWGLAYGVSKDKFERVNGLLGFV